MPADSIPPAPPPIKNHLANYGHPSEVGYKEVLRDWNPVKLDPAKLVETVPATGTELQIASLGTMANALGKPVKSVSLLGYSGALTWKQEPEALVVTLPDTSAFRTALGFKIETK